MSLQSRAIFEAGCAAAEQGADVQIEVMVPLVVDAEELRRQAHPYNMLVKGTGITRDADILSDYRVEHSVWIVLCSVDEAKVAELGSLPPNGCL